MACAHKSSSLPAQTFTAQSLTFNLSYPVKVMIQIILFHIAQESFAGQQFRSVDPLLLFLFIFFLLFQFLGLTFYAFFFPLQHFHLFYYVGKCFCFLGWLVGFVVDDGSGGFFSPFYSQCQ